jgi:hypothetical protein
VDNPDTIAESFIRRLSRGIAFRQLVPEEDKTQFAVTLTPDLNGTLKAMSSQTGMSIEGLVSLMIGAYMV